MKHVVIDEGSSQTKMAWLQDGKIQTAVIPSRVVDGTKFDSDSYHSGAYKLDGFMEYTVDGFLDGALTTDIQDYQTSDLNLLLVHDVLRQNGFGGEDVAIYVTLPIEDYYQKNDDGIKNLPLINKKKDNLMRTDIKNMAGHSLANIVKVSVLAEAIPAWFDKLLNSQGEEQIENDESYKIMVVDHGGTTVDIAIINGAGSIQEEHSIRTGVFNIQKNLSEILKKRFDRSVIETHHIEKAIQSGQFNKEDISEEIIKACKPIERDVLYQMKKMVSDADSLDAVLYAGGGAELTAKRLADQYGGTAIKGNQFSVCCGILKGLISQGIIE